MEAGSGHDGAAGGSWLRKARRWKVLLAHDATASTCDPLITAIEGAFGDVDVSESSSIEDARVALRTSRFDVCMVCLDLPPAPLGGVRLGTMMRETGLPVVLITRSLRWIPPDATGLRDVPWVPPDASAAQVARAAREAIARCAGGSPSIMTGAQHAREGSAPWLEPLDAAMLDRALAAGGS